MTSAYQCLPEAPLYGRVGEPLAREVVEELLRRQCVPDGSERKRLAWLAYDVYENRIEQQVLAAIRIQQKSDTIKADMARHLTKVRNDALDVTAQVAVVWKNGAERHIGPGEDGEGDRDAEQAALQVLAAESDFDIVADEMNQLAWLQGPQFAVPMVRGEQMTADIIGPHIYDIVQDIENPLGMPVGLAWHISTQNYGGLVENQVYVLDSVTLTRYVVRGLGRVDVEPHDPVEHRYGKLPAALLRFTRPKAGDDWFKADPQSRLTSGTIDVGVKMARMGLVRKAQCHRLLTVVGALDTLQKGHEISDPETAMVANTAGAQGRPGGKVDFTTLDFDTDPKNFICEVLFHVQCMVEPYGGHVEVASGAPETFGRIVIPPHVQAEHRNRQVKPAIGFERQWWGACTAMGQAEGHPAANDLPAPAEVEKRLRVNFGQLTRELADPAAATKYEDWELSRGLTSEIEIMRRRLGGVSESEAWDEIKRNMENRAKFNELAARTNQSTDPKTGSVMTTPAANGAMGTPAREENRAAEAAEGDEASAGQRTAEKPT